MNESEPRYLDMESVLGRITEATDPIQRIKRVGEALTEVSHLTAELGRVRREDIEALIAGGMGQNEIGRRIGLTSSRMSQLLKNSPAPERAFFGTTGRPVIAAVAEKLEGGKDKPGPVVSIDDMQAYDGLRRLVEDLGMQTEYEIVRPPGSIRLNRDGLVVICGPRHSPLLAQVLEADPRLGFRKDDLGWFLEDRERGRQYRSPEDNGEPGDVAYFGRLPRPDGRGTFLYIAGIHASGAAGVVHWLGHHLPELYRDVRLRRFSTLVRCQYDPHTHEVIGSETVAPIYRHEVP